MLVLSRKENETIHIGDGITVTVSEIRGNRVRLAISAPREVAIHRAEILDAAAKAKAKEEAAPTDAVRAPARTTTA